MDIRFQNHVRGSFWPALKAGKPRLGLWEEDRALAACQRADHSGRQATPFGYGHSNSGRESGKLKDKIRAMLNDIVIRVNVVVAVPINKLFVK